MTMDFIPSTEQLSSESGLSQTKYKNNMGYIKKESKTLFRMVPFMHLPEGYGPVELDFHQNFSAPIPKKEGGTWVSSVRCRKGITKGGECAACTLAEIQKKEAGGAQIFYKEDISRTVSSFVAVYEVTETYDRATGKVDYNLDAAKPLVLELYREQYKALGSALSEIGATMHEHYFRKLWMKEKKRLAKENEMVSPTEAQLAEAIGQAEFDSRRKDVEDAVAKITPFDPKHGVVFRMNITMVAGANGLKNKKNLTFEAIFDPDHDTSPIESLPMPPSWDVATTNFKTLKERFPEFSNDDLGHFRMGNFNLMEDKRFVPKNREANDGPAENIAGAAPQAPRTAGAPPAGIRPAQTSSAAGLRPAVSSVGARPQAPVGPAPIAARPPPAARPTVGGAPSVRPAPSMGATWAAQEDAKPAPSANDDE